jgi:hypothetical protein
VIDILVPEFDAEAMGAVMVRRKGSESKRKPWRGNQSLAETESVLVIINSRFELELEIQWLIWLELVFVFTLETSNTMTKIGQ